MNNIPYKNEIKAIGKQIIELNTMIESAVNRGVPDAFLASLVEHRDDLASAQLALEKHSVLKQCDEMWEIVATYLDFNRNIERGSK